MKTMNYFTVIALILFGTSCTQSEITETELSAVKGQHSYEEKFDFLNGLAMYKRSTEVQLFELDVLIAELAEAMDGGEQDHEEEFENALKNREVLREFQERLDGFRRPFGGGRGPGPKPPKGCFIANCLDGIDLNGITGITIPEETNVENCEITGQEGQNIGHCTELIENEFGDQLLQFETEEFEGVGTMRLTTTVNDSNLGEVVVEIPISFN